jgi:hypothetical protein
MKIGELAFRIHVHRVHAWRLARAGVVPGTKKTKGGHFYFVESKALTKWINYMKSWKFRKKIMKQAYHSGYGGLTIGGLTSAQKKEEKELWRWFKHHRKTAAENRREFKGYTNQYSDLFEEFFYDTDDLIRILEEMTRWVDCKIKSEMIRLSAERLSILRDLINNWLSQQQSSRT